MRLLMRTTTAALLLLGCASLLSTRPAAAQNYQVVDLGTLRSDGAGGALAHGINNRGQVVGLSDTSDGSRRGFLWEPGTGISDIRTRGINLGGRHSDAWSISNNGIIGGEVNTASTPAQPFEFSHAFVNGPAGLTDLNGMSTFLGGQNSRTRSVNDAGQACGLAQALGGNWRAFRYSPTSGMQDLGTLGGLQSRANSINARGEAVGASDLANGSVRATLWSPTRGLFTIFFNNSRYTEAFGVNDSTQMVGVGQVGRRILAFRFDPKTLAFQRLNGLRGAPETYAYALNNAGQAVGASGRREFNRRRAVLWLRTRAIDLNSRIPAGSGWVLWSANGINDRGQIVGEGTFNGRKRAFLLTPIAP